MNLTNSLFVVDSHTEGQPSRILVGGLPKIPGNSVAEKRDYLRDKMDYIRTLLCNEPRAHNMEAAILVESESPGADFGVIYCSADEYDEMSGHGTMGVCTVLVELGMVKAIEPVTNISLDTPAGLIQAKVNIKGQKVQSVSLINVPAFLYERDVVVAVPGYGEVKGDVAFGGIWYFYIQAADIGVRVRSENINDLIKAGITIKNTFNNQFDLVHPTNPYMSRKLHGVSIIDRPVKNRDADQRNIVVEGEIVDRCPCGTGTCGRMAILHNRNQLPLNKQFLNESITGTVFSGKLLKETTVGNYPAVIPELTGRAYLIGFNHMVSDPEDPFGTHGYVLGHKIP